MKWKTDKILSSFEYIQYLIENTCCVYHFERTIISRIVAENRFRMLAKDYREARLAC